jgi:hypothetical protein
MGGGQVPLADCAAIYLFIYGKKRIGSPLFVGLRRFPSPESWWWE